MTPYWHDDHLTLYGGDCRDVLRELPDESVHCVVTSPPYWGLRDYGVGGQLGLEATPEEYVANMVAVFREVRRVLRADGTLWLNLGDTYWSTGGAGGTMSASGLVGGEKRQQPRPEAADPAKFGRWNRRNESAIKPKDLVGIPWRVAFALQADGWYLRSDVIWAKPNPMPESVTDRPTKAHEMVFLLAKGQWKSAVVELSDTSRKRRHLREDGWFENQHLWANEVAVRLAAAILDSAQLKQDLGLPALHPEVGQEGAHGFYRDLVGRLPVEHRAAVGAARLLAADASPEQFLRELHRLGVALADRHNLLIGGVPSEVPLPPGLYAYGQTSIAVDHPGEVREFEFVHGKIITSTPSTCTYYYDADAVREDAIHAGRIVKASDPNTAKNAQKGQYGATALGFTQHDTVVGSGRNLRSVWTIATEPYPGAHFATFPRKLVEPCVKAGTSERGVCPECGAPWVRETSRTYRSPIITTRTEEGRYTSGRNRNVTRMGDGVDVETTGWRPNCQRRSGGCGVMVSRGELDAEWFEHEPVPATVLDPFAGSGTTLLVAQALGRRAVGIDLNPEYLRQALERNAQTPLGLVG